MADEKTLQNVDRRLLLIRLFQHATICSVRAWWHREAADAHFDSIANGRRRTGGVSRACTAWKGSHTPSMRPDIGHDEHYRAA